MKSLQKDPGGRGFTHLATDGVLRSFDGDRNVVDYRKLSPEEIELVSEIYPPAYRAQIKEEFAGVDGRNVTDTQQCLHPDASLMPPKRGPDGQNVSPADRT